MWKGATFTEPPLRMRVRYPWGTRICHHFLVVPSVLQTRFTTTSTYFFQHRRWTLQAGKHQRCLRWFTYHLMLLIFSTDYNRGSSAFPILSRNGLNSSVLEHCDDSCGTMPGFDTSWHNSFQVTVNLGWPQTLKSCWMVSNLGWSHLQPDWLLEVKCLSGPHHRCCRFLKSHVYHK